MSSKISFCAPCGCPAIYSQIYLTRGVKGAHQFDIGVGGGTGAPFTINTTPFHWLGIRRYKNAEYTGTTGACGSMDATMAITDYVAGSPVIPSVSGTECFGHHPGVGTVGSFISWQHTEYISCDGHLDPLDPGPPFHCGYSSAETRTYTTLSKPIQDEFSTVVGSSDQSISNEINYGVLFSSCTDSTNLTTAWGNTHLTGFPVSKFDEPNFTQDTVIAGVDYSAYTGSIIACDSTDEAAWGSWAALGDSTYETRPQASTCIKFSTGFPSCDIGLITNAAHTDNLILTRQDKGLWTGSYCFVTFVIVASQDTGSDTIASIALVLDTYSGSGCATGGTGDGATPVLVPCPVMASLPSALYTVSGTTTTFPIGRVTYMIRGTCSDFTGTLPACHEEC